MPGSFYRSEDESTAVNKQHFPFLSPLSDVPLFSYRSCGRHRNNNSGKRTFCCKHKGRYTTDFITDNWHFPSLAVKPGRVCENTPTPSLILFSDNVQLLLGGKKKIEKNITLITLIYYVRQGYGCC